MIKRKQGNMSYARYEKSKSRMSDRELQEYFQNKYHNRKPKQNKARYLKTNQIIKHINSMNSESFMGHKKSKYFKLGFDACKENLIFMLKNREIR